MKRKLLFIVFMLLAISSDLLAQVTLPVMNNPLMEIRRMDQLLQKDSSLENISFNVRPIEPAALHPQPQRKPTLTLQPFQFIQQFNDKRPLFYNDGSMFSAKGWQFHYTTGLKFEYRNFTANLNPEYTWAYNPSYPGFPTDHYNIIWRDYYKWLNTIDQPERMNDIAIRRFLPGQSRIQYAYKGVGLALSTENLWWGPGRYQSLVMTNQSPGFLHYTLNSTRPMQSPIGTFEWQIVWGGKLKSSGTIPQETLRSYGDRLLYTPKDSIHNRVFTGAVLSWQPKWLKGLFIGFDAASIQYQKLDLKPARMGSIFARYLLPEEHAEVYFQYGRNDKFATAWNLLEDTIPRGYLAGVRKLFRILPNRKNKSYLQMGIEIIQLELPTISLIKNGRSWYTHPTIRQGFTNRGEVLGASVGPGGNAQRLDISFVKGKTRIGFEFERWLHNADFYYNYNLLTGSMDFNRQWVDLMSSFVWSFPIRNGLLFGQFSAIRSINYQWKSYIPKPVTAETYFEDGWDEINLHGRMGILLNLQENSNPKKVSKK